MNVPGDTQSINGDILAHIELMEHDCNLLDLVLNEIIKYYDLIIVL